MFLLPFYIYIYILVTSTFFITLWSVVSVDYSTLASTSIHNINPLKGRSCVQLSCLLSCLQIQSELLGFRHSEFLFLIMNAKGRRCYDLYQFLEFHLRHKPPLHELLERLSSTPPPKRQGSCVLHHT